MREKLELQQALFEAKLADESKERKRISKV